MVLDMSCKYNVSIVLVMDIATSKSRPSTPSRVFSTAELKSKFKKPNESVYFSFQRSPSELTSCISSNSFSFLTSMTSSSYFLASLRDSSFSASLSLPIFLCKEVGCSLLPFGSTFLYQTSSHIKKRYFRAKYPSSSSALRSERLRYELVIFNTVTYNLLSTSR